MPDSLSRGEGKKERILRGMSKDELSFCETWHVCRGPLPDLSDEMPIEPGEGLPGLCSAAMPAARCSRSVDAAEETRE